MTSDIDHQRRRFLTSAAVIAAANLGGLGTAEAADRGTRELAALGRAAEWLNWRVTPSASAGKVVLVDFCTYTCINWLRALPYRRAWAEKYRRSLIVIGVHTPEFAFEHDLDNVRRSVRELKIDYPVALDNDYAIWRAFDNDYWPALYFIDARGRVVHHQYGEGEYERSEKVLQRLIRDAGGDAIGERGVTVQARGIEAPADWASLRSPENYLGYDRTNNFASPGGGELDRQRSYLAPPHLALNHWSLAGEWTMTRQAAVSAGRGGRIAYRFQARDVHLVMGPARARARQGAPVRYRVSIDGQPPGSAHGLDVDESGHGTVVEQRLYQLIRQPKPIVERQLEIEFLAPGPGVEAFAFTFG